MAGYAAAQSGRYVKTPLGLYVPEHRARPWFEILCDRSYARDVLPAPCVINGVSVAAAGAWMLGDLSGGIVEALAGGDDLVEGGDPVTLTPWHGERAAKFAGSSNLEGTSLTLGDVGSNSAVWDVVFQATAGTEIIWDNRGTVSALSQGWTFWQLSSLLRFYMCSGGATQIQLQSTILLVPGDWYHARVTWDGTTARLYVNAIARGTDTDAGTTTPGGGAISFGGYSGGGAPALNGGILGGALYLSSDGDWLADTGEILQSTRDRCAAIFGMRERYGAKTLSMARASSAYVYVVNDDGELEMISVGAGVPTLTDWVDAKGDIARGHLSRTIWSNAVSDSDDMSGAAWSTPVAGDGVSGTAPAPIDGETLDGLVAAATDDHHAFEQSITLQAGQCCLQIIAADGLQQWVYVELDSASDKWGYFNLATGAVGTLGDDASAGWNWPMKGARQIALQCVAAGGGETLKIAPVDSDQGIKDPTYTGHGSSPAIYAKYVLAAENGTRNLDHPFPWFDASVAADTLFYGVDTMPDTDAPIGTLACDVLLPRGTDVNPSSYIFGVSQGVVFDGDAVRVYATGAEKGGFIVGEGGGHTAYNGKVFNNGHWTTIRGSWAGDARLWQNRKCTQRAALPGAMPSGYDRIMVGHQEASATQPNKPTRRYRIFSSRVVPL